MPFDWGNVGSNAFTLIVLGFIGWIIYYKITGSKFSLFSLFKR